MNKNFDNKFYQWYTLRDKGFEHTVRVLGSRRFPLYLHHSSRLR